MINILQAPGAFYPAYNDSYLTFTTTFTEDDRAVVKITGTPYQFTIYPDTTGEYLFNLKNLITTLINTNKFRDNLSVGGAGWLFADSNPYKSIDVEIIAYGDDASESVINTYTFTKGVKQYGDSQFTNPYQLLLPSEDGINYYLRYFEGYPFDFTFRELKVNDSVVFYNKRTEQGTTAFVAGNNSPYRVVIDKCNTNWHSAGVLTLPEMLSRIDIKVGGVVKTSVDITKEAARPGTYLKWFNSDGSYSYWLFNNWYKEEHNGKEIDRLSTNNFTNVFSNTQGYTSISGKEGESTLKLKTSVNEEEMKHLISLITSPMVQMWSEKEPFTNGKWIDVKVQSNNLTYNSKKYRNQVTIDIELPEVNTQLL